MTDEMGVTKQICDEILSSESETFSGNRSKKYNMSAELREKLKEIPEALEYIEKLERVLEKQIKKIIKWKNKFKKKLKVKDSSIQTDEVNFEIKVEDTINSVNTILDCKEPRSIADDIKEAAEIATQNTGFVYEETSGMYYDYNTGYYYNAEYGLYYDGNSGMYLKYNQETQSYEYHSQVINSDQTEHVSEVCRETTRTKRKKSYNGKGTKDWKRIRQDEKLSEKDVEEGECSQSSDFSDSDGENNSDSSDISKQWPPCMRVIIEATENPKIKVGSLHIITCDGGSLGREGKHSILLTDINVSKHHLKIDFDKESSRYLVTDLGSRNGTLLNGKRMSPSKQESDSMEITHGTKIQIGSTVLLCHIHDGSQTCGHCEPGLIQQKTEVIEKIDKISMADKHKNELKMLKKQCGFLGSSGDNTKLATGYTDRAQKRRETVGSQNPHEKTKMASLDESISSENKGFKLLSKMGWKEGQSLGKTGEGVLEPIKLVSNPGTTGVGAESIPNVVPVNESKQNIWKKAQERFQKLPNHTAFEEVEDSD